MKRTDTEECGCCDGTGKIRETGFINGDLEACMTCLGRGRFEYDDDECPWCGGNVSKDPREGGCDCPECAVCRGVGDPRCFEEHGLSDDVPAFYVASKTKHSGFWRDLRDSGQPVSASWIDEAGEGQTEDYGELATRCLKDIQGAECVLLYCEEGELLKGALIEAGMALAMGRRVFCVGTCESLSRVFGEHPLWMQCGSIGEALARSAAAQRARGGEA